MEEEHEQIQLCGTVDRSPMSQGLSEPEGGEVSRGATSVCGSTSVSPTRQRVTTGPTMDERVAQRAAEFRSAAAQQPHPRKR